MNTEDGKTLVKMSAYCEEDGACRTQTPVTTNSHTLTKKMEINLNMLGTLVLNWIAGHVDDTDIITIDQCGAAEFSMLCVCVCWGGGAKDAPSLRVNWCSIKLVT